MTFILICFVMGILIFLLSSGEGVWSLLTMFKSVSFSFLKQTLETNFIFIILIISLSVIFFSKYYIKNNNTFIYFITLLLLFILSMVILIVRNGPFLMFLGWDGLGVTSFFLVGFYQNWKSTNNSLTTFYSNRVGDGILLILFARLIFTQTNLKRTILLFMAFILIILTRMTKSAQFPLSAWLPAAIAAPTPISALVHRSTLVTAGVLILIKFYPLLETYRIKIVLYNVSLITIIVAGTRAIEEKDFKKLVALSTLRQIGILFFILRFGFLWMSFFHLTIHAFFKRLLFFSVGRLLHFAINLQDSRYIRNSSLYIKTALTLIQITLLSLIGVIFFSGYYSKDLFLETILKNNNILQIIIIFGALRLTFLYRRKMFIIIVTNKTFITINKSEISQQFNISTVILISLTLFRGNLFFINIFIFHEIFLFYEKIVLLGFALCVFVYLIIFNKSVSIFYHFFYLNYFTSFFAKRFYLKITTLIERRILEKTNIIIRNTLINIKDIILTSYSVKSLTLVFLIVGILFLF